MRVLVVGSTGTIGKRLVTYLGDHGVETFSTSREVVKCGSRLLHLDLSRVSDFADGIESQESFDGAVLCAGVTNFRECENEPEVTSEININAQLTLTSALLGGGTKRVYFLSSNRVFGGDTASSRKYSPYSFRTEYGRQKATAETELLKLGQAVRVIRLTKVLSEDNPLLKDWVFKLKLGQEVKAFIDVMVSPVTLDDTVRVITDVIESENESVTQFSATDEISYFDMARFVAKFLQVDVGLVVKQNAADVGERPLDHASLECSKFRSVIPTSSFVALQKVLEKMVPS